MKTITIRNVPDETYAELAARATRAGQSLQTYLRAEFAELARRADETAVAGDRPDMQTWMARVRERVEAMGTRLSAEQILADKYADRL